MKITDCITVPAVEKTMGCNSQPSRDRQRVWQKKDSPLIIWFDPISLKFRHNSAISGDKSYIRKLQYIHLNASTSGIVF